MYHGSENPQCIQFIRPKSGITFFFTGCFDWDLLDSELEKETLTKIMNSGFQKMHFGHMQVWTQVLVGHYEWDRESALDNKAFGQF